MHLNFERICILCHHFKGLLQCLPCPQTTLHGQKGMVMAQELYALLNPNDFCLKNNPKETVVYVCATLASQPAATFLLTWTEQARINTRFACTKHYFMLMCNIERACFTALDASVNLAFKVLDNSTIQGWHDGMRAVNILDQLSAAYSQPTLAVLVINDTAFFSPYLAADAPEVLFCWIEDCAEIA
jgi:hypothetical protein